MEGKNKETRSYLNILSLLKIELVQGERCKTTKDDYKAKEDEHTPTDKVMPE